MTETLTRWWYDGDGLWQDDNGQYVRYEDAAAALTAAHAALAECYRLTGADPDGNEDWRLAERAVAEVTRLRAESDAQLTAAHAERDAARQECDDLQQRAYQMIAGIEADAATLVATRRECDARVEQATHAARHAIEGAAEQMNVLRAQRAAVIAEKDHLRAQLTAALRERDALAAQLAQRDT